MGYKSLSNTPGMRAAHIAVRLSESDMAWVKGEAFKRGVSKASILRAGVALMRCPSSAPPIQDQPQAPSPDLLIGDRSAPTVGPVGSIAWARGLNILKGGCVLCPTPTGCAQEKHCDLRRRPWVPLVANGQEKARSID